MLLWLAAAGVPAGGAVGGGWLLWGSHVVWGEPLGAGKRGPLALG